MAGTPDARGAALEILRDVRHGATFDGARDRAVERLPDPERRLAHEIAAGVLRNRTNLDSRIRPLVSAPWNRIPTDLKDILRIGTYQIASLDKVPIHAAVDTSVRLAKRVMGRNSSGLVNAVLRRVGESDRPTKIRATTAAHLAAEYSHPEWLVARWMKAFGKERTVRLLTHNNRKPMVVLQPARLSQEELRRLFDERGVQFEMAADGLGLTPAKTRITELPGFAEGAFVVQDSTPTRILRFAQVPDNALVWDACAAPGGKVAGLRHLGVRVIASDSSLHRMGQLRDTVRRAAPGAILMVADARKPPLRAESVEFVLLDVPCSTTGVMARHPDSRWRLAEGDIDTLAQLQASIFDAASSVVAPGGHLIYSTCSLESEENERQVDRFLQRHSDFQRSKPDLFVCAGEGGDGGYAARLARTP